jgi:hypothetical protein
VKTGSNFHSSRDRDRDARPGAPQHGASDARKRHASLTLSSAWQMATPVAIRHAIHLPAGYDER